MLKKTFHLRTIDDLFLFVEQGDLSSREVFRFFLKELKTSNFPKVKLSGDSQALSAYSRKIFKKKTLKFSLAQCCSPLPGDDISGIFVLGKGVSIHRLDCHYLTTMQYKSPEKVLHVDWDQEETRQQYYRCTIRIEGFDREGLLQDILKVIYDSSFQLVAVNTKVFKDGTRMGASIVLNLKNSKDFFYIKNKIMAINDVYNVFRVNIGIK